MARKELFKSLIALSQAELRGRVDTGNLGYDRYRHANRKS